MKRILIIAAALALAACASPRDAKIKDGEISGITSAEATTLAKQDIRQKKVESVQKNAKPILLLESHDGQPITINAKRFEVNVPQDTAVLLQEQESEVSENVQIVREVRGVVRDSTPVLLGGMALSDRKSARASAERIANTEAETQRQAIKAQADRDAANLAALQQAQQQALDAAAAAEAAKAATTP